MGKDRRRRGSVKGRHKLDAARLTGDGSTGGHVPGGGMVPFDVERPAVCQVHAERMPVRLDVGSMKLRVTAVAPETKSSASPPTTRILTVSLRFLASEEVT